MIQKSLQEQLRLVFGALEFAGEMLKVVQHDVAS